MPQISIRIKDHQVKSILGNLTLAVRQMPANIMRPILEDAKKEASGNYGGGASYGVPTVPGYVRTGRYGSNQKLIYTGGQSYRLENRTPYAVYVGGSAAGGGQARVHRGRWPNFRQVMEHAVTKIIAAAEAAFSRIARG